MRLAECGVQVTRRTALLGSGAGLALMLLPSRGHATDTLDVVIRRRMADARIPGLAVGIAREGEIVFARGYGFADLERRRAVTTDTMFHIASITKTITALGVMLLVEQGRITFDEPVAPHLDFAIADSKAKAITFRHLLMHTSGISDEVYYQVDFRTPGTDASMALATLLRGYLAQDGRYAGAGNVRSEPGTHWDYSNIGYALLGYLAGRIAGTDLRAFTAAHVFRPLGLRRIAWRIADTPARLRATPYDLVDDELRPVQPVGFPDWPAGMIRASVGDVALLAGAVANGGVARQKRLLSSAGSSEMLAMRRPAGIPNWLTGQGLGWQQSLLDGVPRINHWGGDPGVFTMAYVDPEKRISVVALSNTSGTPKCRDALKAIVAQSLESVPG